ncbi:hypothetical protein ACLB1E_26410 [Escherichia coli]
MQKLDNSSQLEINDSGYALVPAVTPYRYNRISLIHKEWMAMPSWSTVKDR